jgi:acyl-CoA synthetase (AMP-forming)/AMP-acid ligase II
MNIAEILAARAADGPDDIAILDPASRRRRITTFAELDRAAARCATLLEQSGLRRGDAVLVFQPMSAELYVALLAVFRLGLIAMFLDPSAGREHIERCCALHAPRGFIAGAKAHLLRLLSPALRRIPRKFVIGLSVLGAIRWSRADALPPRQHIESVAAEAPALLTFTSGSTGQPKAAVRSHGFLLAQHAALADSLHLTRGEVDMATMPIVLLANLASGVTSLIPSVDLRYPGAIDPAPVIAQIQMHQAVSSVASPAFFERLARYCAERRLTLPSFTKLFTGGAPVFPRLLGQMQEMAPAADVVAVYGSTEAEPIAHIARREMSEADHRAMLAGKGLLAGVPVSAIRLRILRDSWGRPVGPFSGEEFAKHCLPTEQSGEIVVCGGHVLPGYLHGQGDEETKFRVDGAVWHRTGDAGYLDGSGRVWLLGRCSARIEDRHGILYPFAAETAVYQDARVRRAAMVSHQGRRVLAVEFDDARAAADLAPLRAALAWTQLDEVRVCRRIPVDKRHNAKIDYPSLSRMLDGTR